MSPTFTNGCGTEPVLGMAHSALSCACSAKMRLYISAAIALVACGGRATAFIVAPAASTVLASQRASSTSRLQAVMTMDSTSNTRRQLFGEASKAAAAILCTEILQTLPAFANDPAWGPQVRFQSIRCAEVLVDPVCRGVIMLYNTFSYTDAIYRQSQYTKDANMGDPKSAKSWYPLLKAGDAALQDLLDDWENIVPAESTNGDCVRTSKLSIRSSDTCTFRYAEYTVTTTYRAAYALSPGRTRTPSPSSLSQRLSLTHCAFCATLQAVRRKLGTVGVSSPLSAVKKAFVGIKDATDISLLFAKLCFGVVCPWQVCKLAECNSNDACTRAVRCRTISTLASSLRPTRLGGGQLKGSNFIKKARKSVKSAKANYKLALDALHL
eukprot:8716-Heterococcus_DN1.PRE.2